MPKFETIDVIIDGAVATLSLNRPDVRNAINPTMIREITEAFANFNASDTIRVVVLRGEGDVFCAGGDLNWMRDVLGQTEQEVIEDSRVLLNMYESINDSSKLIIAAVEGAAIAGALGIVSCADIVISEKNTKFCVSEVKIGLVPGIIAAFIIPRVGTSWFRYLAQSALLFDTETAQRAGLIHEIADGPDDLSRRVQRHLQLGLSSSPEAIAETRKLINALGYSITRETLDIALRYNAKARLSDAAQEGISAFLEKRSPSWLEDR
jgi:methylglutaconyl-CoA hydratase